MKNFRDELLKKIKQFIEDKLKGMLSGVLKNLLTDISGTGALTNLTETKATDMFLKTPLG